MRQNFKNESTLLEPTSSKQKAEFALVLKVPDFAGRYGVTKRTVTKWLKVGLPHLELSPRQIRIPLREADVWVSEKYFRQRRR